MTARVTSCDTQGALEWIPEAERILVTSAALAEDDWDEPLRSFDARRVRLAERWDELYPEDALGALVAALGELPKGPEEGDWQPERGWPRGSAWLDSALGMRSAGLLEWLAPGGLSRGRLDASAVHEDDDERRSYALRRWRALRGLGAHLDALARWASKRTWDPEPRCPWPRTQGHLSEALRSPFARAPTRCRAPSRDSRTLKARQHRSSGRPGYWQWLGGAQRIGVDP